MILEMGTMETYKKGIERFPEGMQNANSIC